MNRVSKSKIIIIKIKSTSQIRAIKYGKEKIIEVGESVQNVPQKHKVGETVKEGLRVEQTIIGIGKE